MLKRIKNILVNEEGIGVVEVILILLVLVGLVLIFKNQIINIAEGIFSGINDQIKDI